MRKLVVGVWLSVLVGGLVWTASAGGSGHFGRPTLDRESSRTLSSDTRLPTLRVGGDRDCSDFDNQREAQNFFEDAGPGDPHNLDADGDGVACEALPCPCGSGSGGGGGGGGDGGGGDPPRRGKAKYKGRFKGVPGSKIKIVAKTLDGRPTLIKRMTYVMLPADCPVSMATSIDGGWSLRGTTIGRDRKFKTRGHDGEPIGQRSSLKFKGKFTPNYDKVKGRFQTNSYFGADNPPEETCVSENRKYVAKR